jgi:hypothetical protein
LLFGIGWGKKDAIFVVRLLPFFWKKMNIYKMAQIRTLSCLLHYNVLLPHLQEMAKNNLLSELHQEAKSLFEVGQCLIDECPLRNHAVIFISFS